MKRCRAFAGNLEPICSQGRFRSVLGHHFGIFGLILNGCFMNLSGSCHNLFKDCNCFSAAAVPNGSTFFEPLKIHTFFRIESKRVLMKPGSQNGRRVVWRVSFFSLFPWPGLTNDFGMHFFTPWLPLLVPLVHCCLSLATFLSTFGIMGSLLLTLAIDLFTFGLFWRHFYLFLISIIFSMPIWCETKGDTPQFGGVWIYSLPFTWLGPNIDFGMNLTIRVNHVLKLSPNPSTRAEHPAIFLKRLLYWQVSQLIFLEGRRVGRSLYNIMMPKRKTCLL